MDGPCCCGYGTAAVVGVAAAAAAAVLLKASVGCGGRWGKRRRDTAGSGGDRPPPPRTAPLRRLFGGSGGGAPVPTTGRCPRFVPLAHFFCAPPHGGWHTTPPARALRSWFPDGRASPWWLRARRTRFFLWLPAWRATSAAAASIQDVAGLVGPPSKRHPPGAAGASAMSRQCRIAAAHGHSSRCLGVFPLPFAKRTVPRLRRGALPTAGPPKRVAAHVDGLRATTGTRNVLCGRAGSGRRGNDMGTDRPQHRGRGWRNEIAP